MELSWRLTMFCMLSPENIIREVHKIPPNEEDQIIKCCEVGKSIRQRTEQLTNNSLIIGELPESQIAIRVPHSVLQQGCEVFVAAER